MSTPDYPREAISGGVLAGGRARRMGGGDKGLVLLSGRPMVSWVVDALRPQVASIVVNANRNPEAYAVATGCPVVADAVAGFAGPLAGMASLIAASRTPLVLTAPCDSPLLSPHLAARLHAALVAEGAELAVASDGERDQPVFSLLRRELHDSIVAFLERGEGKIDRWYAEHRVARADFADSSECFENVNTEAQRLALEATLRARAPTGSDPGC